MSRLLIVEDEKEAASFMKGCIESLGVTVTVAHDGYAALHAVEKEEFDLVLLDIVLPKLDGLHLCRLIRSRERYIPIIVLSALSDISDRLLGFQVGADDYLTKPIDCDVLLAKIAAMLRLVENVKQEESSSAPIRVGTLLLDPGKHQVTQHGNEISLTALEFSLLSLMARSPGKVFTRSQLLRDVWGYNSDCYVHTVESHINRLRRKIEINPSRPQLLLTVRGVGYKISEI